MDSIIASHPKFKIVQKRVTRQAKDNYLNKKKILIYGDINMNIIDGSAIWMRSISAVLNGTNKFEVHVLLKAPIIKDDILQEMGNLTNVFWVDLHKKYPEFNFSRNDNEVTPEEALQLIEYYTAEVPIDIIVLRQIDPELLIVWKEKLVAKTFVYTVYKANSAEMTNRKIHCDLYERCKGFLVQTNTMKAEILKWLKISDEKIHLVTPMIPDVRSEIKDLRNYKNLVYCGKIAADWYVEEIVQAFIKLRKTVPDAQLHVAGDKFQRGFNRTRLIELMTITPGVTWHQRLSRQDSLSLIASCGIGVGWRSPELDNSLEISTKFLEYCSYKLPCIVNPAKNLIPLLGQDYPLYASNEEEFIEKCTLAMSDEKIYRNASEICSKVAKFYSYSESAERLIKIFKE